MRTRIRAAQKVWFVTVSESLDGLNTGEIYGKPVVKKVGVSVSTDEADRDSNGLIPVYDRYSHCYDKSFLPEIGDMAFIDVVPELDENGELVYTEEAVLKPNGEPRLDGNRNPITVRKYATKPDYRIIEVRQTQKGNVNRFLYKKVNQ